MVKIFLQLEQLDRDIAQTVGKEQAEALKNKQIQMLLNHPGFSRDVLGYDTITDKWVKVGELPTTSHVTTVAVRWDGSFVVRSGEFRRGIRTPKIWMAQPVL